MPRGKPTDPANAKKKQKSGEGDQERHMGMVQPTKHARARGSLNEQIAKARMHAEGNATPTGKSRPVRDPGVKDSGA